MNKVLSMVVMVTAMSAGIALAQPRHGMQGMLPEAGRDTVRPQHEMVARDLGKEPARMESWEQRFALHERKCNEQIEECKNTIRSCPGMNMVEHTPRHFFMFPVVCVMILLTVMGMINVLLTVIVSLDMARSKRFNGLWIPILLVAGIPGTALYALFRIGDNVKAKE